MLRGRALDGDGDFPRGGGSNCVAVMRENSDIGTSLRVKESFPCSTTMRPCSAATSSRFVPGASPVEAMKTPVVRRRNESRR